MFLLIANFLIAAALVALYAYLRWRRGWFQVDHFKIPEWISLFSIPLGVLIPVSLFAIDGMLIFGLLFFGNEAIYQFLHWWFGWNWPMNRLF